MTRTSTRIGVSGITGTIGFDFCKKISQRYPNHKIVALYRSPKLTDIEQNSRFDIVRQNYANNINVDLLDLKGNELNLEVLAHAMETSDIFVHFAGYSRKLTSTDQIAEVLKTNVLWPAILCNLSVRSRTARFVLASSIKVCDTFASIKAETDDIEGIDENVKLDLSKYAEWLGNIMPLISDYAGSYVNSKGNMSKIPEEPISYMASIISRYPVPNGIKDLYPLSKYMAEQFVSDLWKNQKEGVILRFSPVFGPSPVDSMTRVIPFIITLIESGKEMTALPWSTCMIYLEDLQQAVCNALYAPVKKEEHIIHLGSHMKRYSQKEVIDNLLKSSGRNDLVRLIDQPSRYDHLLDVSRAKRLLNLQETPLSEALDITYHYFIENRINKN